jgi:hypothetical protein
VISVIFSSTAEKGEVNLRPLERPVITAILRNDATSLRTHDVEVAEEHVAHSAPSSASWLVIRFVVSVSTLHEFTDPGLDVNSISNRILSTALDDGGLIDVDILY